MSEADASRLQLRAGDSVELVSRTGRMTGRVFLAALPSRTLQAMWPEANVLIGATSRDHESGIPDYNARVTVRRA